MVVQVRLVSSDFRVVPVDLVDQELLVLLVQQVRQDFRVLPEQLVFREVPDHRDLADIPELPDQSVSLSISICIYFVQNNVIQGVIY